LRGRIFPALLPSFSCLRDIENVVDHLKAYQGHNRNRSWAQLAGLALALMAPSRTALAEQSCGLVLVNVTELRPIVSCLAPRSATRPAMS
jgi:hypothetical protein